MLSSSGTVTRVVPRSLGQLNHYSLIAACCRTHRQQQQLSQQPQLTHQFRRVSSSGGGDQNENVSSSASSTKTSTRHHTIHIANLGRQPYDAVYRLQKALFKERMEWTRANRRAAAARAIARAESEQKASSENSATTGSEQQNQQKTDAERSEAEDEARISPPPPDVLLIVEHNDPGGVYTMGKRNTKSGIRVPLKKSGDNDKGGDTKQAKTNEKQQKPSFEARFRHISRGGALTWHGPGQAMLYPIVNLDAYTDAYVKKAGGVMRWYTDVLEKAIASTVKVEAGLEGAYADDTVGVWMPPLHQQLTRKTSASGTTTGTGDQTASEETSSSLPSSLKPLDHQARKIGFCGIEVAMYICMHGISLNVDNDLSEFDAIEMCGLGKKLPITIKEAVEYFHHDHHQHQHQTNPNPRSDGGVGADISRPHIHTNLKDVSPSVASCGGRLAVDVVNGLLKLGGGDKSDSSDSDDTTSPAKQLLSSGETSAQNNNSRITINDDEFYQRVMRAELAQSLSAVDSTTDASDQQQKAEEKAPKNSESQSTSQSQSHFYRNKAFEDMPHHVKILSPEESAALLRPHI